ncbi:MAG: hypothetical protein Q8M81_01180 [Sediminibacterium sp.]|nr:hypothetical protein [Sediminibacterium sp.]
MNSIYKGQEMTLLWAIIKVRELFFDKVGVRYTGKSRAAVCGGVSFFK